jgi:hypothetical protein
MPSEPKPKLFVAQRGFSYRGRSFNVGDPVEDRRIIDHRVKYGDRFIKAKRSKSPAVDTATTPSAESKEG